MNNAKIYADAYQLAILIFERTRTFPKHHRPTLGRRLEEASLNLTIQIRMALVLPTSRREHRLRALDRASTCLDEMRIVSQMSRDLRLILANPYKDFCELSDEIGRELGGLRKFEEKALTRERT